MSIRRRSARGQSLVEFALVIPIVLLLMLGLFDLGRVVFTNNSLSDGARHGARTAAVDPRSPTYCADIEDAARTAVRGLPLSVFTVTYQRVDSTGVPTGAALVVCSGGSPGAAIPSSARPGDRVTVVLTANVDLATPLVAAATGQDAFTLTGESTMTVTFAPAIP